MWWFVNRLEGNPCQVVDIIFSMQAIAQCLKDADFKDTISSFAVDALERKYKFRLSRGMSALLNLRTSASMGLSWVQAYNTYWRSLVVVR